MKYFILTRKLPHPFYYFRSCKFSSFILNGKKGVFMRGYTEKQVSFWMRKGEKRRWMVHKNEHDHERRLNVNYFLFTTLQQQLYSTTKIRISIAQKLVKKFIVLFFLFSWATAKNLERVFVKCIKQFRLHIFADLLSSSKKLSCIHQRKALSCKVFEIFLIYVENPLTGVTCICVYGWMDAIASYVNRLA